MLTLNHQPKPSSTHYQLAVQAWLLYCQSPAVSEWAAATLAAVTRLARLVLIVTQIGCCGCISLAGEKGRGKRWVQCARIALRIRMGDAGS